MKATMTINRGTTTYVFESSSAGGVAAVLAELVDAERWVYNSPNRLAALDERSSFEAAQPGDTIQLRTR